ncbi:MAG: GntR family transcriptional regulator, partial [Halomonas sp.]
MDASSTKVAIEQIAERITDAVMEHRLPPGIKLVEEKLASAFGVSRTKIRQALTLLAQEGLVTLHPNRGAFVKRPTAAEA